MSYGRESLLKAIYRNKFIYISLLPAFTLLAIFRYYPAFSAFYHALFKWSGIGVGKWVGFGNFIEMFKDPVFHVSLKNMGIITLSRVGISLIFPLLAAELTFNLRNLKAQYIYRTLFVVPMVVPVIVTLLLWGFIYRPDGLLNTVLKSLKLDYLCRSWLGDFDTALPSIIFIGFPWIAGSGTFAYLIYLAGLQAIPRSLFEASMLDGANRVQQIFSIDIPLIIGQIKLILILTIIVAIQSYYIQLVLTEGGPGYATMVPGLYMYINTFSYFRMGYGCAVGIFLFVMIFVLTVISRKYIHSDVEFEAK